jgi:hypothetical protein
MFRFEMEEVEIEGVDDDLYLIIGSAYKFNIILIYDRKGISIWKK